MRVFKIILDSIINPYKNIFSSIVYREFLLVIYRTFALWCFNLAPFVAFLIIIPLILTHIDQTFEAWGFFIRTWFINPYQLYYFFLCFIFSLFMNFTEQ